MIQIIYASAATAPFTTADLRTLLSRSRARNLMYNVTGMLVYHAGSFLQVLEGVEANVECIYASIERDPRHTHARVLLKHEIAKREFPEWAMSYLDTSAWSSAPGLLDFQRSLPQLTASPTAAKRYLRFFQEGLYREAPLPDVSAGTGSRKY